MENITQEEIKETEMNFKRIETPKAEWPKANQIWTENATGIEYTIFSCRQAKHRMTGGNLIIQEVMAYTSPDAVEWHANGQIDGTPVYWLEGRVHVDDFCDKFTKKTS